jgi:hypothetical protein
MRKRFRIVQKGDGFENTEPNARGVLPELMRAVGYHDVQETHVVETPTGSVSIYRAAAAGRGELGKLLLKETPPAAATRTRSRAH